MFKAIEIPAERDLSQFTRLLWQRKISHRLHHLDQVQIVAVAREEQVAQVRTLYLQWEQGEVVAGNQDSTELAGYFDPHEAGVKAVQGFIRSPLTILVVLFCVILALVSGMGGNPAVVDPFLYPDFAYGSSTIYLSRVVENFTFIHFLKMIGPAFMHAGLVHLAFNMLWFWEFGRRIEAVQASWTLLILIVVLALVSNTTQYVVGGGNNFLGLSGVVYGMLAYIWMWQLFDPQKGLGLPPALIFIMLVLLVVITMLDLGFIANGGHIGGLLAGVVYGALTASISRIHRATQRKQSI